VVVRRDRAGRDEPAERAIQSFEPRERGRGVGGTEYQQVPQIGRAELRAQLAIPRKQARGQRRELAEIVLPERLPRDKQRDRADGDECDARASRPRQTRDGGPDALERDGVAVVARARAERVRQHEARR
jgi:hypothetical protein